MAARPLDSIDSGANHVVETPKYGVELLSKLNACRNERAFTDVVLCVDCEEFPCHRNVLAVSSPYFNAMFTSDLKESHENKIMFNEVSAWTLKRLIDYAYSGRLEITAENAQELLAAGSLFDYPAIVNACCTFLSNQLHPSNCLGIEIFAQMHSCEELQEDAHKFVLENFIHVTESSEFLELSLERLDQYISSDLIDVRREEEVWEAVLKWIRFDLDERGVHLSKLMEQVRLPVMELENLNLMEQDELIRSSPTCLDMVREAQVHHESIHDQQGKRRRSMQTPQVQPRPSTVAKEVLVVVGGIDTYITRTVEMFDPQKDKWLPLPDFPQPISRFSMAALSNCIYVSGGIANGKIIADVWMFDAAKRKWHQQSPMLKPRAHHSSAILNDRLYIFGGITYSYSSRDLVDVDAIECYDPHLDSWKKVGESMFARKQSRVVAHNSNLVEIGGLQGDAKVNTMVSYTCADGKVTPSEQYVLPDYIKNAQAVVLNGIFYIIWEESRRIIALDPEKRKFHKLPEMTYARVNCDSAALNGKIYVTGGTMDSKASNVVESFDPATNRWTLEKAMTEARANHGCISLQMC